MGTCCHFCYDPVCTDRLEKRMDPSSGIGGKDGIRLFAVVAIAGNLLGMILTLQNGGQVYPQGYRLEKEDTGSYEKEFMVSVDGEEPVSMYIQVPEKELEEQEEEPKQNKKLTRKEQAQKKYCRGSIPV